jgi:DNA-binding GntR family transcriptional regulator
MTVNRAMTELARPKALLSRIAVGTVVGASAAPHQQHAGACATYTKKCWNAGHRTQLLGADAGRPC